MSDLVRILYVTASGERGGAEIVLETLIEQLDRARFEPAVICLREGPLVARLRQQTGVDVAVVPAGHFRDPVRGLGTVWCLRREIRARRSAVVHCNGTGAHLYAGIAARLAGVPSLYHLHDTVEWSWTRQGIVHLLAALTPADATVAVSDFVARRFRESWGTSRTVSVIHNGVVTPEDRRERAGVLNDSGGALRDGIEAGGPQIVWCGRLQRWKGTHIFVKAAALLRPRCPTASFVVVGGTLGGLDAGYDRELHELARSLDLNGCVRFTGHQSDVRPFLEDADMVVHSSLRPEPFGLAVLEAMALGKPVIASNLGGPVEMVEDGVSGLLVPPGDAPALAQAMEHLLDNDTLRSTMGREGRRRATELFNAAGMVRAFEDLYVGLAAGGRRVSRDH